MRSCFFCVMTALCAAVGCTLPGATSESKSPWAAKPSTTPTEYATTPTSGTKAPAPETEGFAERVASFFSFGGDEKSAKEAPKIPAVGQTSANQNFKHGLATPGLYVSMAELAEQGDNVANARQLYQQALGVDPADLQAMLGLARLEDREGNLEAALQIYQQAAAAHPASSQAVNDLALCFARKGDLETSVQLLENAVALQPEKPLYRNNLAKVLVELNRLDHAVACQEVVHGPAVAQYNTGVLLMQRGRIQEAKTRLEIAVALDPQLQPAKTLLANLSSAEAQAPKVASQRVDSANSYQAYLAATQNAAGNPTAPPATSTPATQGVLPTPPAAQPVADYRNAPTTTAPVTPQGPIEVPGQESPTRLGQTPSGLPPIR